MNPAWQFLAKLEEQEARLLAWGVVDGAFSPDEVREMARVFAATLEGEVEGDDLVDALVDQHLLVHLHSHGRPVIRTRMAESVRLFARLRQLFPRRDWRAAPTLVADYRFALRPRRYPERNRPFAHLLAELAVGGLTPAATQHAALRALATHGGELRDLASFQLRAVVRVLGDLRERRSRGMIVGAGTGTGKTLAFYLPALAHLAGLVRPHSHWTKAIAVYPRNELLKDQFAETYAQARKLDGVLRDAGTRKLLIGAYFGLTPTTASERDVVYSKWPRQGDAFACPYLRCPRCGRTLLWYRGDLRAGREQLKCADVSCKTVVQQDEVVLTRERMRSEPPDVLFTTTETLNIRMTDAESRHVFGIGTDRAPRLVLLDEVHTYAGVHGAQVAYVLRRWRKAIGPAPVQFTGLSATLPNATEFFAQLVGLPADAVESVEPVPGEMKDEGMEYLLALRGDPASGAALLSTTIQTTMLLRRALDAARLPGTDQAAGTRVFVFADDLDVTNRLYHNLLDAEGLTGGTPPRPKRGAEPLAGLRAHRALAGESDPGERLAAGQSWYMAEQIGHVLHPARSLRVGRTTSQDAGVGQDLDVVVATASLEVGYNDPAVGAVVQHKAPREVAAFLQRKGRAGRDRKMRPWTVVVLSDYGRDRAAYQSYDQLFDPSVETRTLPVGNRHVLRMQAAFAVMDWIAARAPGHLPLGSVWRDFSKPGYSPAEKRRQGWEAELIRTLLEDTDPAAQRSLEDYLAAALQVAPDEVRALMWEPPRALMLSVLPTLLRRLEQQWGKVSPVGAAALEPYRSSRPLPEFVPENLFSDLNLPEVVVETPAANVGGDPETWPMPVLQAMRTLAPGRVTRRFAPYRPYVSHWVPLPALLPGNHDLPVGDFCAEYEELGPVQVRDGVGTRELPCYRPWRVRAAEVPREVGVTSNAFLDWRSQLSPADEGERFEIPPGGWEGVLAEVRFFVHALHSHVQVRRFALGSQAVVKLRNGNELDAAVQFVTPDGGGAACVGFVQESDGLVFRFRVPDGFRVGADDPNGDKLRAFRTAYFRHRAARSPVLAERANIFQRERLAQVYLSALTARALVDGHELQAAAEALAREGLTMHLSKVLGMIFQTMSPDDERSSAVLPEPAAEVEEELDEDPREEAAVPGDEPQDLQRVARVLRALVADPAVTAALHEVASALWAEPDEEWHAWAKERFTATLGGALLEACYRLCPQAGEGDLLLDLDGGPRPPDAPAAPDGYGEIWVTEATIGGGGLVEELLRRYAEDPRRFFLLARSALAPSDFEIVDAELTRVLELLAADGDMQAAVANVRNAPSHRDLQVATEGFRDTLTARGILVTHPVTSAVHARILRPASSPATDAMLLELVRGWRQAEAELGIEIDARVFAYAGSATPRLDTALAHVGQAHLSDPLWRFGVVYSLLWPRGGAVRARVLESYNPFATLPEADRSVVLDLLQSAEAHVGLGQDGWRESLAQALSQRGAAHLYTEPGRHAELRAAVLAAVGSPLDVDYLHLYPQVEGVERTGERISVRLHVREVLP